MKTVINNTIKCLLASVIMLMTAVYADAQFYFPPVSSVSVTPGASGVRVSWDGPTHSVDEYYQFVVVTYKEVTGVDADGNSYVAMDTVSIDTTSSTTFSIYASKMEGRDYVAGENYKALVALIANNKLGEPKSTENFQIASASHYITVRTFDTYKYGSTSTTPDPDYVWVSAYGAKYTDGQTIPVADGETISLSGHTQYPDGSSEASTYGFCRWIVDGVSSYDSTAYVVTPSKDMTVYMCVGNLGLADISQYSSKYSAPSFTEPVGSNVCGNNMLDTYTSIVLTTGELMYTIDEDNNIEIATTDEIAKHVTFSTYDPGTGNYNPLSSSETKQSIENDATNFCNLEFYNDPSINMDNDTQYRIDVVPTVDGKSLCDQWGNVLLYKLCMFNTSPEATRIIAVTDKFGNTYTNGGSQSLGTIWSDEAKTLTKTFALVNSGSSDLQVTSISTEGTNYSIASCQLKKGDNIASVDPSSSQIIRCNSSVIADAGTNESINPDTLFVTVQFKAAADLADAVHTGTLKIISDDNSENGNYVLNLTVRKGDFYLPYSYQADGETKESDGTLYQNYSSVNDVPSRFTIGGNAVAEGESYYKEYNAYTSEGSCVINGTPALRCGGTASNMLAIDVKDVICKSGTQGVGQINVRWSANGYRKLKIYDNNSTTYLSTELLKGGVCHENSVVVSSCTQTGKEVTTIYISFEGPESNVLTTISELDITPCDAELKSSQADITTFQLENATNVRIYDDVIFLELPDGECSPTQIKPTIVVSPGAEVTPASGAIASIRKEVSELSGLTTEYFLYTVLASNKTTTKTYKVYVDCPQSATGCYKDTVDVSVLMNEQDQVMSIVEFQNSGCTVPVSGKGSNRTIHYLTKDDKPINGVYEISGPRVVCIGTTSEYAISNAAESNGAKYHWIISRAPGTTAKESFTVVGGVLDTIYTDEGAIDKINQIYDGETMKLTAPNSLTDAEIALKIIIDLEYTDSLCAQLSGEANAEIYATKMPPTPVTSVSAGCVGEDGRLKISASQANLSDVYPDKYGSYTMPIDATTYTWNLYPSSLNSKFTEVLGDPSVIYVNLGEDVPDISVIVGVQNGCGVGDNSNYLTVDYAAHETEWTGEHSSDWHDNDNWTHHAPSSCTNVIIRDVEFNDDANTEEAFEKAKYYPVVEDGTTAECKNITFRPGAGVKGLHKLTYDKAFVQIDLQRDKYYTLTAPLADMYTGDFYFNGMPEMEFRFFKDYTPGRSGSTISEDWTISFESLTATLDPGKGFLVRVSDTVWNFPNGVLTQKFSKVITFPRLNTDSSLVTTVYPHSTFTGKLFTKMPQTMSKTDLAYRFALESNGALPTQFTIGVDEGLNLVPNPLMCHLSIEKFMEYNSDMTGVIDGQVKFWNGSNFVSFMPGSKLWAATDANGSSSATPLMPPMQSFLVWSEDGGDLTFDCDDHFVADVAGDNNLRADAANEILHVSTAKSGACIARRENTTNGYGKDDAFKLFPSVADKNPNVYFITGGKAVDIDQFATYPYVAPVGIRTNAKEPVDVTLNFNGAESYSDVDVVLVNNVTGEEINLKDESTYTTTVSDSVDNSTLQIEFRTSGGDDEISSVNDATSDSDIQIFVENGNTIRVACSSDNKINTVEVFNLTGRTITKQNNINASHFDLTLNSGASTVTVKATTDNGVKVEKVLIR